MYILNAIFSDTCDKSDHAVVSKKYRSILKNADWNALNMLLQHRKESSTTELMRSGATDMERRS